MALRIEQMSTSISLNRPGQAPIHTVANWMWLPALAMGFMAIVAALVLGILQADAAADLGSGFSENRKVDLETLRPLTSGVLFLGEALILSGISFLLATILGALRWGGGEVQEARSAEIKALKMPWPAKVFVMLMMVGVMSQFVAFGSLVYVATQMHDAWSGAITAGMPADSGALNTAVTWSTWANPLRQVSLGFLLVGIVFALYSVSVVLNFQFSRVRELISSGE